MSYNFSNITITDILRIVSVKHRQNSGMTMNERESAGLIVALSGQLKYSLNGTDYVSDPGHALLLSKGITYSFVSITESISVVINFETKENMPFNGIESIECDARSMATRMENNWAFQKKSYRLKCMEELYSFFIKYNNDASYVSNTILSQIKPSIEYMEEHYTDSNLNNDDLAALSGVSTVYFRKLFTKKYGVSPMKYVHRKRIEKAKNILESEYVTSISDLAEFCGYSSVYYFSKAFKQETSCSPTEYCRCLKHKNHITF